MKAALLMAAALLALAGCKSHKQAAKAVEERIEAEASSARKQEQEKASAEWIAKMLAADSLALSVDADSIRIEGVGMVHNPRIRLTANKPALAVLAAKEETQKAAIEESDTASVKAEAAEQSSSQSELTAIGEPMTATEIIVAWAIGIAIILWLLWRKMWN